VVASRKALEAVLADHKMLPGKPMTPMEQKQKRQQRQQRARRIEAAEKKQAAT
jgi:hypothetical protein